MSGLPACCRRVITATVSAATAALGPVAYVPIHTCRRLYNGAMLGLMAIEDTQRKPSWPPPQDFIFQQTMLRVRDPQAALDFYTRVLGMTLLAKLDFPSMSFSLYFLAYEKQEDIPQDPVERVRGGGQCAGEGEEKEGAPHTAGWHELREPVSWNEFDAVC